MKCILLCAGYATRLQTITKGELPKHLLTISGDKTVIDYNLEQVNTIDEVDSIYIITNARYYDQFVEWNKKHINNPKPITILNDGTTSNENRLGAIGDIKFTIDSMKINDEMLIIAADSLFDYPLRNVIDFYKTKNSPIVVGKEIDDYEALKRFAVAKLDDNNQVIDLVEKPEEPQSNIAIYATYVYPKSMLEVIDKYIKEGNNPDAPGRLVQHIYKDIPVFTYVFDGEFYDVGTPETLEYVRKIYKNK